MYKRQVHHLVVGVEQLDAMVVGIAHIDEQRMARAVAAGPVFDVDGIAHLGREIADVEEVIGFRDAEGGVMQPRPGAGREHDVVRIALALQEHEEQFLAVVGRDVFREPEAQAHPELAGLLHVRHQQLEVVDALRHRAVMILERHHQPRLEVHGGAELDRRPVHVRHVQRTALMRHLGPLGGQAQLLEMVLRLLQVLLGEDPQADPLCLGLTRGALEHEAVVAGLCHPAQIDRVLVLVADDEADQVDVEVAALGQILDGEHGMARARDVEGRIVDGLRDGHGALRKGIRVGQQL